MIEAIRDRQKSHSAKTASALISCSLFVQFVEMRFGGLFAGSINIPINRCLLISILSSLIAGGILSHALGGVRTNPAC